MKVLVLLLTYFCIVAAAQIPPAIEDIQRSPYRIVKEVPVALPPPYQKAYVYINRWPRVAPLQANNGDIVNGVLLYGLGWIPPTGIYKGADDFPMYLAWYDDTLAQRSVMLDSSNLVYNFTRTLPGIHAAILMNDTLELAGVWGNRGVSYYRAVVDLHEKCLLLVTVLPDSADPDQYLNRVELKTLIPAGDMFVGGGVSNNKAFIGTIHRRDGRYFWKLQFTNDSGLYRRVNSICRCSDGDLIVSMVQNWGINRHHFIKLTPEGVLRWWRSYQYPHPKIQCSFDCSTFCTRDNGFIHVAKIPSERDTTKEWFVVQYFDAEGSLIETHIDSSADYLYLLGPLYSPPYLIFRFWDTTLYKDRTDPLFRYSYYLGFFDVEQRTMYGWYRVPSDSLYRYRILDVVTLSDSTLCLVTERQNLVVMRQWTQPDTSRENVLLLLKQTSVSTNDVGKEDTDKYDLLRIFPLPAHEGVFIAWERYLPATVRLITIEGRVLYEQRLIGTTAMIPLGGISSGVYLLEIELPGRMRRHLLPIVR